MLEAVSPVIQTQHFAPRLEKVVFEDVVSAVVDIDKWEGMAVDWKSPMRQFHEYRNDGYGKYGYSIKAFRRWGAPKPLKVLMALCGFWALGILFLRRFAQYLGIELAANLSCYELVKELIRAICPDITEEELLDCLEHRVVNLAREEPTGTAELLLESDDCTDCLEKSDQDEVHQDVQKGKRKASDFNNFFKEYVGERKAHTAAKARAAGVANPRAKARALPAGVLSHAKVKELSPPGSFVWRNFSAGSRGGRLPPLTEMSRSWHTHGQRGAPIMVLRKLWNQYISLGKAASCPIRGLMLEAALEEDAEGPCVFLGS